MLRSPGGMHLTFWNPKDFDITAQGNHSGHACRRISTLLRPLIGRARSPLRVESSKRGRLAGDCEPYQSTGGMTSAARRLKKTRSRMRALYLLRSQKLSCDPLDEGIPEHPPKNGIT